MFIAHVPAGYLATRALLRGRAADAAQRRRWMALGLAASVLPDLDLLYFYLLSDRRTVHHAYAPHLPLAWVPVLAVALVLARSRAGRTAVAVFGANVLLHLVLDTVAGGIRWLWPWSPRELVLAHVTARHDPWWLNFLLHWSFALELALLAAAAWVYLRRKRGRPAPPGPSPAAR